MHMLTHRHAHICNVLTCAHTQAFACTHTYACPCVYTCSPCCQSWAPAMWVKDRRENPPGAETTHLPDPGVRGPAEEAAGQEAAGMGLRGHSLIYRDILTSAALKCGVQVSPSHHGPGRIRS